MTRVIALIKIIVLQFLQITATVESSVDLQWTRRLRQSRPLIIAHRGSSGMLPEHTMEAYKLAVQQGTDVIECDVAVSKDRQLLCTHEAWLNATTDVHTRAEFKDRIRTYYIPAKAVNITDYFTIDFTLAELKTLRRVQVNLFRDQSFNGKFPMASFDDYVAVAQNTSNIRTVMIYPETKDPLFFNSFLRRFGTNMENLLLDALQKHGYTERTSPCFIQSLSLESLQYMAERTKVRLVFLTKKDMSDPEMEECSSYITGLGPDKNLIVEVDPETNRILERTLFLDRAHSFGFLVHPFTFRNEYQFLAYDYGADPYREYQLFIELGVDGLFTDFPWSLSNYLSLSSMQEQIKIKKEKGFEMMVMK